MPTACFHRLLTAYNSLKLQAIIHTQIDAQNCLDWGEKISKEKYFEKIQSVHPIYNRLIEEPNFMVSSLYYASIQSLIISFSSTLEFFLKDNVKLNMMRNYSLLKKALFETNQVIDPKDIVDIKDIELIRLKYINIISQRMCSGELWKSKFKKYVKIMSLPKKLYNETINDRIDSLWKARNDIAHANTQGLSLEYNQCVYKYDSHIGIKEFTQFVLLFTEIVDEVITFLHNVDELSLKQWKTTDATLLLKSTIKTSN